jgi:hypothetical protein
MEQNNVPYTISETCILPSRGLIYEESVDPQIELRSMNMEDEMRRQAYSETPNKVLADMIENCIINKPGIHVYDMCLGDYEYLLHRLRVVTYGSDYKMIISCPLCRQTSEASCNLDELEVNTYDESIEQLKVITLPVCKKQIELNFLTPRILDNIALRAKEIKKKAKGLAADPTYKLTLQAMIKKIDGQTVSTAQLETFVGQMLMKDVNYLEQKSNELNGKVGVNPDIVCKCGKCGHEVVVPFRINNEFFRPEV